MTEQEQLFEQVYRTYGPSLYRFCLLQMKNPVDAEDVLQEVFCKRLYRAPAFASPDHEQRWLFRVRSGAGAYGRRDQLSAPAGRVRLSAGDSGKGSTGFPGGSGKRASAANSGEKGPDFPLTIECIKDGIQLLGYE